MVEIESGVEHDDDHVGIALRDLPGLAGPEVPEAQLWQDPVPAVDHELIDENDAAVLKAKILDAGLCISELVATAWGAASSPP